ncbi:CCT domain-containing protein [Hirschfeldia incana]|nr:CCT domain-containing protein [Hirschfeldia incana]
MIEEPMLAVDHLSQEIVELSDLGSLQSDQQLIEKAFYECEQEEDLSVKSAVESPLLSDVLDTKNVSLVAEMDSSGVVVSDVPVPKSVSSGNLRSMDHMTQHEDAMIQRFFPPVDNGMRRAFSEGDIQVRTKVINSTFLNSKHNIYFECLKDTWGCVSCGT